MTSVLLGLLFGVVLFVGLALLLPRLRKMDGEKQVAAKQLLGRHGLTPRRYDAPLGEVDLKLRAALSSIALEGHVIIDAKGPVLCGMCPQDERAPGR